MITNRSRFVHQETWTQRDFDMLIKWLGWLLSLEEIFEVCRLSEISREDDFLMIIMVTSSGNGENWVAAAGVHEENLA